MGLEERSRSCLIMDLSTGHQCAGKSGNQKEKGARGPVLRPRALGPAGVRYDDSRATWGTGAWT